MSVSLRIRRDTEARWLAHDPVPHQGELCMDITNHKLKLGDGFNEWSKLSYMNSEEISSIREEYGNETDFIIFLEMFKL